MSVAWIAALAGAVWFAGLVLVIGLCVGAKRGDGAVIVAGTESDGPTAAAPGAAAEVPSAHDTLSGHDTPQAHRREPFARRFVCHTCGAHMRRPTICQVCLGTEFEVAREHEHRVAGAAT